MMWLAFVVVPVCEAAGRRLVVQSVFFVAYFLVLIPATIWNDFISRGSFFPGSESRVAGVGEALRRLSLELRSEVLLRGSRECLALTEGEDLGDVVNLATEPFFASSDDDECFLTVVWQREKVEKRFAVPRDDAMAAKRRLGLALGIPTVTDARTSDGRKTFFAAAYDVEVDFHELFSQQRTRRRAELESMLARLADASGIDWRLVSSSSVLEEEEVDRHRRRFRCSSVSACGREVYEKLLGLHHVDANLEVLGLAVARSQVFAALENLDIFRKVSPFARPSHAALFALDLLEDASRQRTPQAISQRAAAARVLLEDALRDPKLALPQYFPSEHLLAIYAPFFAPLFLPVALGQYEEIQRYRSKVRAKVDRLKADAAIAAAVAAAAMALRQTSS